MVEDDELAQIKKKRLEELMKRQHEAVNPKPQVVIEVFTSPTVFINRKRAFVGAPPSIEALRQALKN